MYLTARLDSTIQPGKEEVSSSRLVGSRTPSEMFGKIHGPSSKSPLITALSAQNMATGEKVGSLGLLDFTKQTKFIVQSR